MITVSLVSHDHGDMIVSLINSLIKIKEVENIIVTLNVPEAINFPRSKKIKVINNPTPIGFGQNHNNAFKYSKSIYFCVINPDISILKNPFPVLISELKSHDASLIAPLILNPKGSTEDSVRHFPSISFLLKKLFFSNKGNIVLDDLNSLYTPDWVAGMFMLFKSESYRKVNGFDEQFFLYYEDVDLCVRLWRRNLKVVASNRAKVIHDAQRASRNNFTHFGWHILSIIRYLLKHWGRLPKHE